MPTVPPTHRPARQSAPAKDENYFRVRTLARARKRSRTFIISDARRKGWPQRFVGNRLEFLPPPELALLCQERPPSPPPAPTVKFADLKNKKSRQRVLFRFLAVKFFIGLRKVGPAQPSLIETCRFFRDDFSPRSLRVWISKHAHYGLNGLVDQKQGRVGQRRGTSRAIEWMI